MSINQVIFSAHKKFVKPQSNKVDTKSAEDDKPIEEKLDPVERTVVSSVAPVRRLIGIPDMIKQGDTAAALGLAALTVVSLPEDCRDLKAAYDHSACVLTKKRLPLAYNYKKYQHDFSFFRGTLLHEAMKRIKSERGKRIVDKLYCIDKTFYNTKFGQWIQKKIGITNGKAVTSRVKTLWGENLNVSKIIVKNDFIGLKELTGRAMKRTSILGVAFMGLLELPRLIKSVKKGENNKEKAKSFGIQTAKSSMNVVGLTAGMGYLGAIGAKKFGAAGSLIGMGLGVIAGAAASKGVQNVFFKDNNKLKAK